MKFESLKTETTKETEAQAEKKILSSRQKGVLQSIGAGGMEKLEDFVMDLDPKWEGTKYFREVLKEIKEPTVEEELLNLEEILEQVGLESSKEAEEIWSALQKYEIESEKQGSHYLTPEEAPWVFESLNEEEKSDAKNYFSKLWQQIKKLVFKK